MQGCSADIEYSDTSPYRSPACPRTDSDLPRAATDPQRDTDLLRTHSIRRPSRRRVTSTTSTDDTGEPGEDEDLDVDDEQFLLERQRCRQERLQQQHKKGRKRQGRRSTVGTCTREDGILPDVSVLCPRHGTPLTGRGTDGPGEAVGSSGLAVPTAVVVTPVGNSAGIDINIVDCKPSTTAGSPYSRDQHRTMTWSDPDQKKHSSSPDSPHADKDKLLIHPRIRELSQRKLSGPARTLLPDDRGTGLLSEGDCQAARIRSGSVPAEATSQSVSMERSRVDMDIMEKKRLFHQRLTSSLDSTQTADSTTRKTLDRTKPHTRKPPSLSGIKVSRDLPKLPAIAQHPKTLQNKHQTPGSQMKIGTSPALPALLTPDSSGTPLGETLDSYSRRYSSMESIQKLSDFKLLKVPPRHPMEYDGCDVMDDSCAKQRNPSLTEDVFVKQPNSDTLSVCTLDADSTNTVRRHQLREYPVQIRAESLQQLVVDWLRCTWHKKVLEGTVNTENWIVLTNS